MTRKPTADERDRAIVAKAKKWESNDATFGYFANVKCYSECSNRDTAACSALARIANRIVREEAKRGKRGK